MADKSIDQLNVTERIYPTDRFVVQQSGQAKSVSGQVMINHLTEAADGHGGIQSVVKVGTSGLVDTYRITLADTTTFDFVVTNGRSINSIAKTSTSGLVDTYTISYNNGTTSKITVTNGAKGDKGDNVYTWIKYASQEPTESSHSMGDIPDAWRGEYNGPLAEAPTDWKQYKWYKIKGDQGNTGDPARLLSSSVSYMVSDSGTIVPSGSWQGDVPAVPQGKYLWTRVIQNYNTGSPVTSYSVSRMGMDGKGTVSTVAGISPDSAGNVALTAANVGAVPASGGAMTGALSVLDPTESAHAASKGYVDGKLIFASVALPASGWADNVQTVSVSAVTADASVTVAPDPSGDDNYTAYTECGVRCTAVGDGTMTFKCTDVPAANLAVNVAVHK